MNLARLLELLGGSTVDCVDAPRGLDVHVVGPRLYDPTDPAGLGPGEIVLAVNVEPGSPTAAVAVAEAAQAGAAAIALKGDRDQLVATLMPLTHARRLALLNVAATASWDQLHALIRNAVATSAAPTDTDDDQVPLGDLFALANALAAAIGAAVTIEAADATLLAYSNLDQPIDEARRDTILGRRTPGSWAAVLEEEGVPKQLLATPGKAVRVHDPEARARDRVVVAVRAGTEILGTVWVVEGDKPLDDRAHALLEEASSLAALHLLRHRAADDLHRAERSRLLQALLDGQRSAAEVSPILGIDANMSCAVVSFHLGAAEDIDIAVRRSRALDLILLACDAYRRRVVVTGIGSSIYALFPSAGEAADARLHTFVEDVAARATTALGTRVRAGIGSTVPRLSAVADSRRDADRAVRVLTSGATELDRLTARLDDVRVHSILLELGDLLAARPDLSLPALDELTAYDAAHGKEYVPTLVALAAASWDNAAAARAMQLHPNSMRYRLKRLEEISGLVLDDPAHRLIISLQLLTAPRPQSF
jgi:sugar diacid utilization regulator